MWNPWKRIRQLEIENAGLARQIKDAMDRVDRAESDAFVRAFDHYTMRTKHLEAQNKAMMEAAINLQNMSPAPMVVTDDMLSDFWKKP